MTIVQEASILDRSILTTLSQQGHLLPVGSGVAWPPGPWNPGAPRTA